jgi:glycosyltransferase involved in cell wall biosynthesis
MIGCPRPELRCWWEVLDVLRQDARMRLVVLARGGSEAAWANWLTRSPGLAVEVVPALPTAEELAAQLACYADVVLMWHPSLGGEASSYEARMALASGVPVLASRTDQFDDLTGVVHQPASLAEGAQRLIEDEGLRADLSAAAHEFCESHSWEQAARQHQALWRSLEST